MKKYIYIVLLIAATIALGFLRDYIFISINHVIESGSDAAGNLPILKWILTFLFSVLYFALACGFIFVLFSSKKYIRLAVFLYALLFMVSFFAAATGYFFSSFENIYPFVRTIMGIAQSPVVMMILVPACFINESKLWDKKS